MLLRSLAAKISLLTCLFVLTIIGLMAHKLLEKTEESLHNEMRVRAEFFARSSREAIFPKVDPFSLHFHVEELVKEKAVVYALVADSEGKILSHSNPRFIGEILKDPAKPSAYDISAPILVGPRQVGTVRLGFDESSLQDALRGPKREIMAIAAVSILLAILGTVLIVGWMTRPLPLLAGAAREVAKGNFKVQVEWKSGDEIGVLARAFNDMTISNALMFEAIRHEKEKLEGVFNGTREGMIWAGTEGSILLINPAARALLGWDEKKKSLAALTAGFSTKPALAEIYSSPSRITPLEFSREQPKRLILAGLVEKLGGKGEPPGFLFIFRDATVEKREESLTRSFLSLVSHKLRTPLAVSLGNLELILQEPEKLDAFQQRALGKIYSENNHLRKLVETLIIFSTVESPETMTMDRVETSALELVEAALKSLKELLAADGVSLTWEREAVGALPRFPGDAHLLKEALKNLIENAVKFNPAPRKEIRLSASASPSEIKISVADNGPGIPSEEHPKLFKKFYQVDADFTGQVPGMGLGLAFVKNVAQAHGGGVGLRSEPGRGSEFFFTLALPAR